MTTRRTCRVAAAAALALAVVAVGCGKKGPPLAPFVRIPAAVDRVAAARFGQQIFVTLTVPAVNVDMSVPVDIARIDVYGYTGTTAPARAQWVELGTLVATIPVSVPSPASTDAPPLSGDLDDLATAAALPGTVVTVLDSLDAEELVQGRVAAVGPQRPELAVLPTPGAPAALRRFYIAVPLSQRDRPGPPGQQAEVPLTGLPEAPTDLQVTYDQTSVSLAWEPSGGLLGFILDRSLPQDALPFYAVEPAPTPAPLNAGTSVPLGPTTYQVYRDAVTAPVEPSEENRSPPWSATLPVAMNPAPVRGTTIDDAVEFGSERCYTVRAQRGGALSEASPRVCVTPVDTFPPGSPVGLAAVPSEGAINLIWEQNTEPDLGGYLVLRSGPGDATLRQLTSVAISDARYRDTTVESGARYSYAVVAVDSQLPEPNASAPSAPVEEVAR